MKFAQHLLFLALATLFSAGALAQAISQEEDEKTDRQEESGKAEKDQAEKNEEEQETKRRVERALWAAKEVPENAITVSVHDGVVRLEGQVDNLIEKRRAARVAESIPGVISVSNLILVDKSDIPDTVISANVTQALAEDPIADAWDVVVQVDNGVVTLKGTVNSYAEKMAADDIAMNVEGVRDVRNLIRTSVIVVEDDELEERIENRLAWNARINADEIEVEVENGVVNLAGIVGSAYEKRLAWQNSWVPGVNEVLIGDLEVAERSEGVNRLGNNSPVNERTTQLGNEVAGQPRSISVGDNNSAPNGRTVRLGDEEVAKRSEGVSRGSNSSPANERTARLSDEEIENAIQVALLQNPRVFPFKPEVSVENNVVTLSGTVGNLKARNSAAQTAFNVEGVRSVVTDITVKPERQVSDAELKKRASRALSRDVVLEADDNVQVEVEDSVATITGKPDSYFEKMQALDAVAKVDGIVAIDDRMSIDYEIPAITYIHDWDPVAYDFGFDYAMNRIQSDNEIAREIAAEYRSSPYIDSAGVNVEVNEGVATLNGTVNSWSEYHAAMENALEGGAVKVINRLNVEGST